MIENITESKLREAKQLAKGYFEADIKEGRVTGIGIGDKRLRVYVVDEAAKRTLPDEFQGIPVEAVVTGEIRVH